MSQQSPKAVPTVAPYVNSLGTPDFDIPNPAQSSAAFINLSAHIPPSNRFKFADPARLSCRMAARIRHCVQSDTGCYVYVTGVTEGMIDLIDSAFKNLGIRGSVRFTYENDLEAMIIKCMPSQAHEKTSRSFLGELTYKIGLIPGHSRRSVIPVGSTRFSVPGKRSKEGDEGIKPTNTREDEDEWPSLVVEVGHTQSLQSLRHDAHWWLDHSRERTRMVILIQITKDPKFMHLERWERLLDPDQPSTLSRPKTTPGFEQYFDIDLSGNVDHHPSHPDLVIPYKSIFDDGYDEGTDIAISKTELSEWALYVFLGLH